MKPLSIHIKAHDYLVNGKNRAKKLFSEFPASDFDRLVAKGVVKGGRIPKVGACVAVVRNCVENAHIIDGRKHHAILLKLLTHEGVGTMISRS
jgi:acetylglutamate kinase